MSLEVISEHRSYGGTTGFYRHRSEINDCLMQFAVYVPPQAAERSVPVVTYLAGLTCTEETFMIKAGAQRLASELGLMLVAPDTSPRGDDVPDDPEGAYDFGLGAGFYLNATAAPWSAHYQMYDYITEELPALLFDRFPGDRDRQGITGHSMGGHGALTIGLKNPDIYRSISAFAPICNPMDCPWGQKAFSAYLGDDRNDWREYDATELLRNGAALPSHPLLVDQGMADQFLDTELRSEALEQVAQERGLALELRRHDGYDHGYYFISTFMADHLRHHAAALL